MKKKKFFKGAVLLTVSCFFFGLIGCGATGIGYKPVIDTKGVDLNQYDADLADCTELAEQVNPVKETAINGVGATIFGTLVGAALGAVVGDAKTGAALGAITGGGAGIAGGADSGIKTHNQIIRNCMIGRGYKVLY